MWRDITKERPTEPGTYWFDLKDMQYPVALCVHFDSNGRLTCDMPSPAGSISLYNMKDAYWWDERIPFPQSGQKAPLFTEPQSFSVEPGYEALAATLQQALDRAQRGKGRQRHADGITQFTNQPMFTIVQMLGGSPRMLLFQAMKKMMESKNLDTPAAMNELLDAIIYTASCVMLYAGLSENREA